MASKCPQSVCQMHVVGNASAQEPPKTSQRCFWWSMLSAFGVVCMQLIFDIGDEPTHFFVILSGRIDIWSHPPGVHRQAISCQACGMWLKPAADTLCTVDCRTGQQELSYMDCAMLGFVWVEHNNTACGCGTPAARVHDRPKSIVSVLRRGDAFGDQAIVNREPHGAAASPSTNATLLVVSRQVRGSWSKDMFQRSSSCSTESAPQATHRHVRHAAAAVDCCCGMCVWYVSGWLTGWRLVVSVCCQTQDFLSVLGSHFQEVAATWQHFLVTHVAPLADSDPSIVRRTNPLSQSICSCILIHVHLQSLA